MHYLGILLLVFTGTVYCIESRMHNTTSKILQPDEDNLPEQHVSESFTAIDAKGKKITITGNAIVYMPAAAERTDISYFEGLACIKALNAAVAAQGKNIKVYYLCPSNDWWTNSKIKATLGKNANLIYAQDFQQTIDGVMIIKHGVIHAHIIGTTDDIKKKTTKPITDIFHKKLSCC